MFWSGFGYNGVLKIVKTGNRLDAVEYQKILDDTLKGSGEHITVNGTSGYIFQQDNATIHTAVSTKTYLEGLENVKLLSWPSRSPDLNPMENLWSVLAHRVYSNGKQYSTLDELEESVYRCWNSIEIDILQSLIHSMPDRIGSVLFNQGGITDY